MQPPPHVVAGAATVPKKGSRLLLPLPPDVERARAEAKASHDRVLPADMTLLEAATKLGVDAPLLLRLNQARPELKGLQLSSELLCGTRLRTRPACLLLTAHCSLLTAHCSLLTTHYSLLTATHYSSLLTTRYSRLATHDDYYSLLGRASMSTSTCTGPSRKTIPRRPSRRT